MKEFEISTFEKGMLSEHQARQRQLVQKWKSTFPNIKGNEAVLVENVARYLTEENVTTDVGGYDNFVFQLTKRTFPKLIAPNIVSVQTIMVPKGKVFYSKPEITTGATHSDWVEMYEAQRNNTNFDLSRGVQTTVSGTTTGLSEINYYSGQAATFSFTGGMTGLSSLQIKTAAGISIGGDVVAQNASNVIITTGGTAVLWNTGLTFNNILTDTASLGIAGGDATFKIQFSPKPTEYIVGYQINANVAAMPTDWAFCGSTNGVSWTQLDVQTGVAPWGGGWITRTITPTTAYTHYAFANIANLPAGPTQIHELAILTGTSYASGTYPFSVSPQTWTRDLLANNQLELILSGTGGMSGTIPFYAEWTNYSTLEAASTMQKVRLNIISKDVDAVTRKLKAHFTQEMEMDFGAYGFGPDLSSEYAELMSREIAAEVDREIIRDLIRIAPFRSEWWYDYNSASAVTGGYYFTGDTREIGIAVSAQTMDKIAKDTLLTKITQMDSEILKANIYHAANFIVASLKVGTIIESMLEHETVDGGLIDIDAIHKTGKLLGRIAVYVDPYLPDNILLMGYNGTNWDSGYIYAPYIIAQQNPVRDPDTLFDKSQGFMVRDAKAIITNKKYGVIDCRFPADYNPVNGDY